MNLDLTNVTYEEFRDFCNRRAADGQWSMFEAMACIDVINEIDKIKVRGLFGIPNRKATREAREAEWKRRNYKTIF